MTLSAEVTGYLQNIIVFLRLRRAVASGVSAKATAHFRLLVRFVLDYDLKWIFSDNFTRCLAPLQRTDFVFPSLVAVAVRKVYRHRIFVNNPENDRSLLYGSTLGAVESVMANATAETIIEDVITEVDAPL